MYRVIRNFGNTPSKTKLTPEKVRKIFPNFHVGDYKNGYGCVVRIYNQHGFFWLFVLYNDGGFLAIRPASDMPLGTVCVVQNDEYNYTIVQVREDFAKVSQAKVHIYTMEDFLRSSGVASKPEASQDTAFVL